MERASSGRFTHWQVGGPFAHHEHVNHLMRTLKSRHEGFVEGARTDDLTRFEALVIVLLDIDCAPTNSMCLDTLVAEASAGCIAGNAQRSNHLDNMGHIYVAPSCLAVTVGTLARLGWPPADPNGRSDCCEEWTWRAEELGIPVRVLRPLSVEGEAQEGLWSLDDRLGYFGIGTTFGTDSGTPMNWHGFELFREREPLRYYLRRLFRTILGRGQGSLRRRREVDRAEWVSQHFREFLDVMTQQ